MPLAGPDEILEFDTGDTNFNLLGTFASITGFGTDDRIVIYNTSPGTLYQDAVAGGNLGIITPASATLTLSPSAIYAGEHQIQIDNGPTDFQFAQQSPGQRLFVVEEPVSYICNPVSGRLQRHDTYGFNLAQPTSPGGNSFTVMAQLLGCNMTYTAGTSERGGLLTIRITVGQSGSETVSLLHQVHVENVP